jgi:hypothetical protein
MKSTLIGSIGLDNIQETFQEYSDDLEDQIDDEDKSKSSFNNDNFDLETISSGNKIDN